MFLTRPLCSPSTSIVRQTLLAQGPCTTSALHSLLHADPSTPLPSRPPPTNFLSGARRSPPSPSSSSSSPAKPFPGEQHSKEGSWSISYLKKNVLAGMHQRGEVLKLTRGKWERALAAPSSPSGVVVEDSKTSVKGLQKHEEEHVWVVREEWERVSKASAEVRAREKESRRQERDGMVGQELKREWGVEM